MINIRKLIAQLSNATVVVQKLPAVKGHLRLVTRRIKNDNKSNSTNQEDDQFFFKEPGKKKASRVSKPFCSKCNITIENQKQSDKRCRKCGTILLYKCMTCRIQYTSYRGIQMHLRSKCDETVLNHQCSVCDYATNTKISLTRHLRYAHENLQTEVFEEFNINNIFICPICHKRFKYRSNLTNHLKACKTKQLENLSKHETALTSCKNKLTSNKTNFDHNLIGYSVKHRIQTKTQVMIKYRCLTCDKTKKGLSKSRSPRCKKCDSLITLICKKCNKQYQNYESLKYHIKSKCNPSSLYQCSKCSYTTTMKDLIRRHIKNMHWGAWTDAKHTKDRLKRETLDCFKCGVPLKNFSTLHHVKYCGMKPNLLCKLCSYRSRFKQNIKKHLLNNHSEVNEHNYKDYIKDLSNKKFVKKSSDKISESPMKKKKSEEKVDVSDEAKMLTVCCPVCKHEIEASKSVDTKCTKCEVKFYYKCKKCEKSISNFHNSKIHVRKCLSIYLRLQCNYCEKENDGYYQLNKHLRHCKSKALYTCQYCFYKGKNKSDMNVHKKRCKQIKPVGKTNAIEAVENDPNAVSKEEEVVSNNLCTQRQVTSMEAEAESNRVALTVNGIDIFKKRITECTLKIHEMASRHCKKCKRVYEGCTSARSFCKRCKTTRLYHQCHKCKKRYEHSTSLMFHLRSQCYPTVQYICSICNYTNYIKSMMVKHAKYNKHLISS